MQVNPHKPIANDFFAFMAKDGFLDASQTPYYFGAAAQPSIAPPITNRGVAGGETAVQRTFLDDMVDFAKLGILPKKNDPLENLVLKNIGKEGKFFYIRIPQPDTRACADYALIDWLNFTMKVGDFYSYCYSHGLNCHCIDDDDAVTLLSEYLFDIFGFGVSAKRAGGLNCYKTSFDLGYKGWGHVCIGGQNDTVLISLKGQGLLAAQAGWEKRLYNFLKPIPSARITRIDLAHDSFDSKLTIDNYFSMYLHDLFTCSFNRPKVAQLGDWVNDNTDGRTLAIGSRKSGKLLRIYEKGHQLGGHLSSLFPRWIRVELELRSDQKILPLAMLLSPGQYLAGQYPALSFLTEVQTVTETKKKTMKATVEKTIQVARTQFGRALWALTNLFGLEQTFQILTTGREELPKSLDFSDYSAFKKDDYLSNTSLIFKTTEQLLFELGESLDYQKFIRDNYQPLFTT